MTRVAGKSADSSHRATATERRTRSMSGAGAGDSGDDGRVEAVDRVRSQSQQAGTVDVQADGGAGLLECLLGAVHPRLGRVASAGMRSTAGGCSASTRPPPWPRLPGTLGRRWGISASDSANALATNDTDVSCGRRRFTPSSCQAPFPGHPNTQGRPGSSSLKEADGKALTCPRSSATRAMAPSASDRRERVPRA